MWRNSSQHLGGIRTPVGCIQLLRLAWPDPNHTISLCNSSDSLSMSIVPEDGVECRNR